MSDVARLEHWNRPDRGVLFVVTGPSGVGKSTLVRTAMQRIPGLAFSVSATTRAPREGEVDGIDYHFLDREAFEAEVARGAFLEHATVYGRSYGTLRAPVQAALDRGDSIVLDIDVQGAEQVRRTEPEAVHVFLLPPNLATLEARLRARATDDEATIRRRMAEVEQQLRGAGAFDYLVVNDHLETAHTVFQAVLLAEMSRRSRRDGWIRAVNQDLDAPRHRGA